MQIRTAIRNNDLRFLIRTVSSVSPISPHTSTLLALLYPIPYSLLTIHDPPLTTHPFSSLL
jgi:hypothetical protein